MKNVSFDELRLIAQIRNISDYENKSKEDLIKALSKPKPEPKIRVKINKRKLKNLKDFDELRHKFSKKKKKEYRKAFYVAKSKKYLSESEIKKTNQNLNQLEKGLRFKKFCGNIDSVDYEDPIIMIIIIILLMMMNTEKLVVLEH